MLRSPSLLLLAAVAALLAALVAWVVVPGPSDVGAALGATGALSSGQAEAKGEAGISALDPAASGTEGSARRAGGQRIGGHVEGEADGARLAGWRLVLWSDAGVLGEATSDQEGRFAIVVVDSTGGPRVGSLADQEPYLSVDAPAGWESVEPRIDIGFGSGSDPESVVVLGRRSPSRALVAQVVDATTGEPVPRFEIAFEREDWGRVAASSDAAGRLATGSELAPGRYLAHPVDHPLLEGARYLPPLWVEHGAGRTSLAVEVGPTFVFDIVSPAGVDLDPEDLVATVRRRGESQSSGSVRWQAPVRTEPLDEADEPNEGDERVRPWLRLRPFDLLFPFVRRDDPAAYSVDVADARLGLFGTFELPCFEGRHPTPVRLELARRATVRGRVVDEEGEPVASAQVTLFDGLGRDGAREQWTSSNGVFVLDQIPSGPYTLRVFTREHGLRIERLALAPGEEREFVVHLRRVATGRIAGKARSASGAPLPYGAYLRLAPLAGDSEGLDFYEFLEPDPDSGESRFDFGELPLGEYELSAEGYARAAWEPASLRVQAPREDLEFVFRDDRPLIRIDAEAEGPLYLRAVVNGRPLTRRFNRGRFTLPTHDPRAVESWALLAKGRRPVRGDGAQLATRLQSSGAVAVEAPRREGWARVVFVHEGYDALRGVAVRVDGVRIAATGVDGGVLVEAPRVPEAVTLDLAGYHVLRPEDDGFELRFEVERE